MVVDLETDRAPGAVQDPQDDLGPHPEREGVGDAPREFRRGQAQRHHGIEERHRRDYRRCGEPKRLRAVDRRRERRGKERCQEPQQARRRQDHFRGASIFSSSPLRIVSVSRPSSSSSGEGAMRWRSAGSAMRLTSSGVT